MDSSSPSSRRLPSHPPASSASPSTQASSTSASSAHLPVSPEQQAANPRPQSTQRLTIDERCIRLCAAASAFGRSINCAFRVQMEPVRKKRSQQTAFGKRVRTKVTAGSRGSGGPDYDSRSEWPRRGQLLRRPPRAGHTLSRWAALTETLSRCPARCETDRRAIEFALSSNIFRLFAKKTFFLPARPKKSPFSRKLDSFLDSDLHRFALSSRSPSSHRHRKFERPPLCVTFKQFFPETCLSARRTIAHSAHAPRATLASTRFAPPETDYPGQSAAAGFLRRVPAAYGRL